MRVLHYQRRYGYPFRWALPAELFWRIEHLPWSYDGQPFGPLARWGYRMRHACERRGYAARVCARGETSELPRVA